jgi:NADPH:quinone reductase
MNAIEIQSHGGLEVLRVTTLPDPEPIADEVLVRIKASAVNPLDGMIRRGDFPIAKKPPLILGEEAAGVVERNGAGFKAGERAIVYGGGLGVFRDGTWAEVVAVPASSLRRLPDGISFVEGAALTNVGVTAYGALRTAELKAGETLKARNFPGFIKSYHRRFGQSGAEKDFLAVTDDTALRAASFHQASLRKGLALAARSGGTWIALIRSI